METWQEWLLVAEGCIRRGDFTSLIACGKEILAFKAGENTGKALLMEAYIYQGDIEAAEGVYQDMDFTWEASLRNLWAKALLGISKFQWQRAFKAYRKIFYLGQSIHTEIGLPQRLKSFLRRFPEDNTFRLPKELKPLPGDEAMLKRAYSFFADLCLLSGYGHIAGEVAFFLSEFTRDKSERAFFYSKGLFASNYTEGGSKELALRHYSYEKLLEVTPYKIRRIKKHKRIRVGYVSGDFRQHAVAGFLATFFAYADKKSFMIYGYSLGIEDEITKNFSSRADVWRNLRNESPQAIAQSIYEDEIDILVDFAGHTNEGQMRCFALRPAPIQLTALGYINTSGLSTMDYYLTDQISLSKARENFFRERPLAMKGSHLCFSPEGIINFPKVKNTPPVLEKGYITFCSFNNFNKVTEEILSWWIEILGKVPGSRLVLKGKAASTAEGRAMIRDDFVALGGDASALELRPFSENYLEEYGEMDIMLDTAPYNGGYTSCCALYMGVPIITLEGRGHSDNFGLSILHSVGLDSLVANTREEYIAKAVSLARDTERLCYFRQCLRKKMEESPLMNGRGYMQELEGLYKAIYAQGNSLAKV